MNVGTQAKLVAACLAPGPSVARLNQFLIFFVWAFLCSVSG